MSAEFDTWRRHARRMVSAGHRPDCPGRAIGPVRAVLISDGVDDDYLECVPPPCPGCVTPRDRVLWSQLADEADRFAPLVGATS